MFSYRKIILNLLFCFLCLYSVKATEVSILVVNAPPISSPTPLLNTLTATGVYCYSTRLLKSSYAGSSLRVQRSSDSTQQDIGFTSGQLNRAALLSFVGSGNGTVVTWYNQCGSVNAAAGTQPQIVASGVVQTLNGNPAILFGLSGTTNLSFTASLSQPDTIVVAIARNANVSNGHFTDGNSSTPRQLIGVNTGVTEYQLYAGSAPGTGGTLDFFPHEVVGIFNNASSSLIVDGTTVLTGSPGTNGIGSQSIGAANGGGGVIAMSGWMGEYIVFSSVLGSTDLATLRANYKIQWGTN